MLCDLVFHQTHTCDHIRVCTYPQTEWTLTNTKDFLTQKKIAQSRFSLPSVYIRIPERDKRPLSDIQVEYIANAKEIAKHTNTDPRRLGSLQDTAMYVFRKCLETSRVFLPKATTMEGRWLHLAHRGGLMFAQPGLYDDVTKYDFTSYYPSLCHSDLLFPVSACQKLCLEEFLDLDILAVYRVKMHDSHPLLKLKVIDKLDDDYIYATNLDLQSARDLGVGFTLVPTDDWPNCIRWEGLPGSSIFGRYVDKFFPMKKAGHAAGKTMLNVLTGLLVAKQRQYHSGWADGKVIDVSRFAIQSMTPDTLTLFTSQQQVFKHPEMARLGVFITAHGRRKMIKTLLPSYKLGHLKQVHTDGFVLQVEDSSALELPTGSSNPKDLGGLKMEYQGKMDIVHVNKCLTFSPFP